MASRTKQKEEARARRLAEEQARAERARRAAAHTDGRRHRARRGRRRRRAGADQQRRRQEGRPPDRHEGERHACNSVNQLLTGIPQSGAGARKPKREGHDDLLRRLSSARSAGTSRFTAGSRSSCQRGPPGQGQGGLQRVLYRHVQRARIRTCSTPSRWRRWPPASRTSSGNTPSSSTASRAQEDTGYVTENYLQGLAKQVTGLNLAHVANRPQRLDPDQPGHHRAEPRPSRSASAARPR